MEWMELFESHFSACSTRAFLGNIGTWPEVVSEIYERTNVLELN